MNDKTTVTQRQMLDRLIEFERRLLAHVERMGRALEQARMMQLRRGPFNSRREDR